VLGRQLLMPRIPAFAIGLVLGEMSVLVLGGCKVSPGKLEMTGFAFRYGEVEEALRDVMER
jgi:NAD dependent epimerase/dehydratase family enzyme